MSLKVLHSCPFCGSPSTASLHAFFGEGETEIQRYCTMCHKNFILTASFCTASIDQVLIDSPEIKVSADCKNFSKAQPQRELNKRIRMWRSIASACKILKSVTFIVEAEFTSCMPLVNEISSLVHETRKRLLSEGVVSDGNSKKGKSGKSSKTTAGEVDSIWV